MQCSKDIRKKMIRVHLRTKMDTTDQCLLDMPVKSSSFSRIINSQKICSVTLALLNKTRRMRTAMLLTVIIIACAWLLAGITGKTLFRSEITPVPILLPGDVTESATAISEKHLFGVSSGKTLSKQNPNQIQLLGVLSSGTDGQGIAVFRMDTGASLQVATGETFGSGYRLKKLEANLAVIDSSEGSFEVTLQKLGGDTPLRQDETKR